VCFKISNKSGRPCNYVNDIVRWCKATVQELGLSYIVLDSRQNTAEQSSHVSMKRSRTMQLLIMITKFHEYRKGQNE